MLHSNNTLDKCLVLRYFLQFSFTHFLCVFRVSSLLNGKSLSVVLLFLFYLCSTIHSFVLLFSCLYPIFSPVLYSVPLSFHSFYFFSPFSFSPFLPVFSRVTLTRFSMHLLPCPWFSSDSNAILAFSFGTVHEGHPGSPLHPRFLSRGPDAGRRRPICSASELHIHI